MKYLIIALIMSFTTIVSAQKVEFTGFHSRVDGYKEFVVEDSKLIVNMRSGMITFSSGDGLFLAFEVADYDSQLKKGFNTYVFYSRSGEMIQLHESKTDKVCLVVINKKTYSGLITKMED